MNDKQQEQTEKPNDEPVSTLKTKLSVVMLILTVCFGAGFLGSYAANLNDQPGLTQLNESKSDGNKVVTESEQNIASVFQEVSPSVVSIITAGQQTGRVVTQAAGTGMIISQDGYVLTNKHVVEDASSVTVITSEGRVFDDVEVLGADPLNDVAFLKISGASNLPAVTIGDSKTVRPGQSVIAIGNALGQYQNTVTSGIISGLGRPVIASISGDRESSPESLTDLIQTDAAINSGNSGGPLLNLQGQVIGINTAVAQGAQSIGFAIPIGATKGMVKHLLKTGKVERAVIGLQYISITPEVEKEYDLQVSQGDYVVASSGDAIRPNGPAAKAGLREGDIITKVNDLEVGAGKSISTLIGEFQPGDTIELTIIRGGKSMTQRVTLAAY